jgi:hypothetical protein
VGSYPNANPRTTTIGPKSSLYFFLYPAGHFGLTALTFFTNLPFTHVMAIFFAITGLRVGAGAALSTGAGA